MPAFKFKVKTDNAGGVSANNQFRIPVDPTRSYNYTVDWGDTVVDVIVDPAPSVDVTHTYAAAGTYEISITENVAGGFPTILFGAIGGTDALKCIELTQWGTNAWATFYRSWFNCQNMIITATDHATLSIAAVTNMSYAWVNCISLTSFPLIDTSGVTTFALAWQNCWSLTSFPLINTSSATNIASAWYGCSGLTSFPLIDTSSVTNFYYSWFNCSSLTSFPLIDTSLATSLESTWDGCSSLLSFPLINTSSVTNFVRTWFNNSSLTSFPLIDTSSGINFSQTWAENNLLASFPSINTSSGIFFSWTWHGCWALDVFPLLDFSNMTDGTNMFSEDTLNPTSYSNILESLADNNLNVGVTFHGGNSRYYQRAQDDRDILTVGRGWTINDGGVIVFNADFVGVPTTIYLGDVVEFTNTSEGELFYAMWDFGYSSPFGNTYAMTSGMDGVSHRFMQVGAFTITLQAIDVEFEIDRETKVGYITVLPRAIDFQGSPRSGPVSLKVGFVSEMTP